MASKFIRGDVIKSLDEFAEQEFVFTPYGVRHAGFVQSQQFRFLKTQIQMGRMFKAIRKEDENED